jgi:hypothetical protein
VRWWFDNGLDYWNRDGFQINPPNYAHVLGIVGDVPIIANIGTNSFVADFRVSSPVFGPTSAIVGDNHYFIYKPAIPSDFYRLYVNGRESHSFNVTEGNIHIGLVIIQMSFGDLRLGLTQSNPPPLAFPHNPPSHRIAQFGNPIITINPTLAQPPPQPIILRPINIIDNITNVITIVNETVHACCGDCTVLVRIPDNPEDLRDMPINEIIRVPPPSTIDPPDDGGVGTFLSIIGLLRSFLTQYQTLHLLWQIS